MKTRFKIYGLLFVGALLFSSNSLKVKAEEESFGSTESLRTSNGEIGLRFRTIFDVTSHEAEVTGNINAGYYVAPTHLLGGLNLIEYIEEHGVTEPVIEVHATNYVLTSNQLQFAVVLTGVPTSAYGVEISAYAYVTLSGGTIYSELREYSTAEVATKLHETGLLSGEEETLLTPVIAKDYDTSWYSTEESTYSIYTRSQLNALREVGGNYNGKTIKLARDIDLKGFEWVPIGGAFAQSETFYNGTGVRFTIAEAFQGTFDGDLHTISNLTIHERYDRYNAFFANTVGATIKNINFKDVDLGSTKPGALENRQYATLVGWAADTIFDTIEVSGIINGSTAGGLVVILAGRVVDGEPTSSFSNIISSVDINLSTDNILTSASTYGIGGLVQQVEIANIGGSIATQVRVFYNVEYTGTIDVKSAILAGKLFYVGQIFACTTYSTPTTYYTLAVEEINANGTITSVAQPNALGDHFLVGTVDGSPASLIGTESRSDTYDYGRVHKNLGFVVLPLTSDNLVAWPWVL
ncbi:MAG: hypothetical protein LBM99_01055 [Bacillales bacterium]|jgi:hypothetical protein|nr:hypothetical protein [Bacillales bacterium]